MARPIITVRQGGLSVSVWENEGPEGRVSYSSQLQKRFKDKATGEWRDSKYLFDSDLLAAAELLRAAWHKIRQLPRAGGNPTAPPTNPGKAPADDIPF